MRPSALLARRSPIRSYPDELRTRVPGLFLGLTPTLLRRTLPAIQAGSHVLRRGPSMDAKNSKKKI